MWVRFRNLSGEGAQAWLSIGRDWFMELRAQLGAEWRKQFGETIPRGTSPKAWVAEELRKRGVRLNGREVVILPLALYASIHIAESGDSAGPRGSWIEHPTILPRRGSAPAMGFRRASEPRED